MQQPVHYIFRKKQPQFNSIEEVFGNIIPEINKVCPVETIHLPYSGGLKAVFMNLITFKRKKGVLYHITGHDNYMALRTGRNSVLTIHDIGSAFTGNFVKVFFVKWLWFRIPALLVKQITVISENSKNEVLKLMPFVKNKIQVVHNPLNPGIKWQPKTFSKEKPVILFVGAKPNKNLERAVKALQDIPCHLVIIGKLQKKQQELLKSSGIDCTNECYIPYKRVLEHYRRCDMLLFPALYEGFGLPVLEAQATGRPVLTSKISSLPEVAGNGACLVDPYSVQAIRDGVLKIINDHDYRESLIQKGKQNTRRFDVKKIAGQYREVYKSLE